MVELRGACIALFREGNRVFALDDECPHRGGSLSAGELRGGAVFCPLHAWPFDVASGACLEFPAVSVRSRRAEVRGGQVWVEL